MSNLIYKELSYEIQGAFFRIYQKLGKGHKESVYHNALIEEFYYRDIEIETQKHIKVFYESKPVGVYVPDIVVSDSVIIEIKSKPKLVQSDIKQFWQYLCASEYKLGYLVNFGSVGGVEYIRRVYDTARRK